MLASTFCKVLSVVDVSFTILIPAWVLFNNFGLENAMDLNLKPSYCQAHVKRALNRVSLSRAQSPKKDLMVRGRHSYESTACTGIKLSFALVGRLTSLAS